MKESQALIQRIRRVNHTHQHLELSVDPSLSALKAGQTVLAHPPHGREPYLRQVWFPVRVEKELLTVERPIEEHYEPGAVIHLTGLVGKPFRFRRTLRNVLLVAVDTPPTPLIMPIAPLISTRVSVTLLLLGSAASYETGHLPPEVEIIIGDGEMNWPNRVTTAGWADQVFVVVHPDDEIENFRRVWRLWNELRADIPAGYLYGVFQPPIPCGVGACDACLVRTKTGAAAVCVDGPAIDLTEARLD